MLSKWIKAGRQPSIRHATNQMNSSSHLCLLDTMSDPDTNPDPERNSNLDPLTGEPGAHPVGTGVGAASAGAAGAALGAVAGPVGVVAGAAVGAVVGGLVGKGVAENIDPTSEDGYWQQNHTTQVYAGHGGYDRYRSAYRAGYEGAGRHGSDKAYGEVEGDLRTTYEQAKEQAEVPWEHAKHAVRAAYERASAGLKKE